MPILGATTAPGGAGDAKTHGMLPTQAAAANTAALQATLDAIGRQGGGTVAILQPGTYQLATAGVHPYIGGKRYVVNVNYDNLTIVIGPGVTLKLANGQQTDAGGAVDMIIFKDRRNLRITGGGKMDGNYLGQPGWTQGFEQSALYGSLISGFGAAGGGNQDITIDSLQLTGSFSNPVNIDNAATGRGARIRCEDLHCWDCGEGPQVIRADGVQFINVSMEDLANIAVGDGLEFSECTDFLMDGVSAYSNGEGTGIDLFGSKHGRVTNFDMDGWAGGVDALNSGAITADDIVVDNGTLRNLRDVYLYAAQGSIKYQNIRCYNATNVNVNPIQIVGGAGLGEVELDNITFDGFVASAVLITGSRKVKLSNLNFLNGVGAAVNGIEIVRAAAGDNPVIDIAGGRITAMGKAGIFVNNAGDVAYTPRGSIKGMDLIGNTSGSIQATAGTLVNIEIEGCAVNDATDKSIVHGARRLVDSTGNITTIGAGHSNQLLEILRTAAGTTSVNDISAGGGANINLQGSEALTLEVGDRLTVRFDATTGQWFEIARGQAGRGVRRVVIDGWYRDNIAPSLASVSLTRGGGTISARYYMPKDCALRGFGGACVPARTAGTLTFELWWNSGGPNKTAVIDGTNASYIHTSITRTNSPIAAGAYFEVKVTTDAAFLPATADIVAWIDLEF